MALDGRHRKDFVPRFGDVQQPIVVFKAAILRTKTFSCETKMESANK
ncbi:MAG: hypothetical protein JWN98_1677 [Abditibacteriota bacterium]|nr:hypothetical protein [Abditibacteriota bacterium]